MGGGGRVITSRSPEGHAHGSFLSEMASMWKDRPQRREESGFGEALTGWVCTGAGVFLGEVGCTVNCRSLQNGKLPIVPKGTVNAPSTEPAQKIRVDPQNQAGASQSQRRAVPAGLLWGEG